MSIDDENLILEIENSIQFLVESKNQHFISEDIISKRLAISELDILRGNVTSQENLVEEIKTW